MPYDRLRRRFATGFAEDPGFPALKARVIARTGHHYYTDKDDLLFDRLAKRFTTLGLRDCAAYAARLDGPGGTEEWTALEAEITIGETFFFRYAEQFAALKETILPALIAGRRHERSLRIWSAGCASGAEPYSLAILVHEALGLELPDWDVSIVGTDISAAALGAARAGEYGRWALRTLNAQDRIRWFQIVPPKLGPTREGGYRLRPEYRDMVRFERRNLMGLLDGSLPAAFRDFDLILCRNVLIYFSAEHALGMMRGFAERLAPGGWLLIGHAEPNPAFDAWLQPVALPGTAAYRRPDEPAPTGPWTRPARSTPPLDLLPAMPQPDTVLPLGSVPAAPVPAVPEAAMPLPVIAIGPLAIDPAARREPAAESLPENALPRIRSLADAGRTGEAWRALREALDANPTDAPLRYYEGLLARSLGREAEAERALRGALFLDRDFVMAHFQLGLLLAALGRREAGARALDNALRLAQERAPETVLPEGDGVSAGEIVANVRRTLDTLAGARG